VGAGNVAIVLQPADSFEWVRVVTGVDFSTAEIVKAMPPKKRVAGRTIKAVAYRIPYWGDPDGTRVYPSLGLIAAACEVDYSTAKLVMRVLRSLGLIEQVKGGGGRGARGHDGTQYRLTIPSNLLELVKYRNPDEMRALALELTPPSARSRTVHNSEGHPLRVDQSQESPADQNSEGMPLRSGENSEGMPLQLGGDAPPLPNRDQPLTTPTKTSPEVSTSPVYPQPRVEAIDPRGAVPPATRTTGQPTGARPDRPAGQVTPSPADKAATSRPVQARLWPHAVPDPPDPVTTRGIAAIRAALTTHRDTA
jgi:hypothetical protein